VRRCLYPVRVSEPRWLSADEQRSWRAFLSASLLLHDQLDKELQRSQGLTSADYEILVRLSDAPARRMRMSELAEVTLSSRSRLSHQVSRMEQAGLVAREPCPDDRRGFFAVMTQYGWDRLVKAAPDHVAGVREHLVDLLSAQELAALGASCEVIADHLLPSDD